MYNGAMTRVMISRIAGLVALAYVAGILFLFWGGVNSFIAAAWIVAPVVGAVAFVGASPTRPAAWAFLLLELALIASTGWFAFDVYHNGNSTAPVGFLFLPLPQWGAVLMAFLIALALGWRMRPDFLKG